MSHHHGKLRLLTTNPAPLVQEVLAPLALLVPAQPDPKEPKGREDPQGRPWRLLVVFLLLLILVIIIFFLLLLSLLFFLFPHLPLQHPAIPRFSPSGTWASCSRTKGLEVGTLVEISAREAPWMGFLGFGITPSRWKWKNNDD